MKIFVISVAVFCFISLAPTDVSGLCRCTKEERDWQIGTRPLFRGDLPAPEVAGTKTEKERKKRFLPFLLGAAFLAAIHFCQEGYGPRHTAILYDEVVYDFAKGGRPRTNQTWSSFTPSGESGKSCCTDCEVATFNENYDKGYKLCGHNCQTYVNALKAFLNDCSCP